MQLYVPVSNALGLGSSFRELEELGYKTIFPQTYSNMALWHRDVSAMHLFYYAFAQYNVAVLGVLLCFDADPLGSFMVGMGRRSFGDL